MRRRRSLWESWRCRICGNYKPLREDNRNKEAFSCERPGVLFGLESNWPKQYGKKVRRNTENNGLHRFCISARHKTVRTRITRIFWISRIIQINILLDFFSFISVIRHFPRYPRTIPLRMRLFLRIYVLIKFFFGDLGFSRCNPCTISDFRSGAGAGLAMTPQRFFLLGEFRVHYPSSGLRNNGFFLAIRN
jgi:hypothetical protein